MPQGSSAYLLTISSYGVLGAEHSARSAADAAGGICLPCAASGSVGIVVTNDAAREVVVMDAAGPTVARAAAAAAEASAARSPAAWS